MSTGEGGYPPPTYSLPTYPLPTPNGPRRAIRILPECILVYMGTLYVNYIILGHIYRPQLSWGKVIFSEACVKNFVHKEGCLPHCMLGYTPGPEAGTPSQEQTPSGTRGRHPSQDQRQTPPGADLPGTKGRPPPGADPLQDKRQTPQTSGRHPPRTRGRHPPRTRGRHPPWHSACWEIRATSGRYASYWNAILLQQCFGNH